MVGHESLLLPVSRFDRVIIARSIELSKEIFDKMKKKV